MIGEAGRGERSRRETPTGAGASEPSAHVDGGSERLPRAARIRRSSEIREIFKRGKRKRMSHLDILFAASPASRPRWGMVVPKYGRSGVERNRLRRRLREIGRRRVVPRLWSEGLAIDFMVRARPGAYGAPFAELEKEVLAGMEEACSSVRS